MKTSWARFEVDINCLIHGRQLWHIFQFRIQCRFCTIVPILYETQKQAFYGRIQFFLRCYIFFTFLVFLMIDYYYIVVLAQNAKFHAGRTTRNGLLVAWFNKHESNYIIYCIFMEHIRYGKIQVYQRVKWKVGSK